VRLIERLGADDDETETEKVILPDVAIEWSGPPDRPPMRPAGAGAVTLAPILIRVPIEQEIRDRWIEIRSRPTNELVTVIEVLSPTNKTGEGYGEYRAKRRAVLRQKANLVELDLLLGGRRPEAAESLPAADYYAIVTRSTDPQTREVYSWGLRQPLPTIPVPLRAPDRDVPLDLAAACLIAYDRGGYVRRLRYDASPVAPLRAADREWAQGVVR
jgi:hypothetical protein